MEAEATRIDLDLPSGWNCWLELQQSAQAHSARREIAKAKNEKATSEEVAFSGGRRVSLPPESQVWYGAGELIGTNW